jgi:putative addiction module component (TIGR02574 family)
MTSEFEAIAAEAMQLSPEDRAHLAHLLLASLDGASEAEFEALWRAEEERRFKEFQSGAVQGIPAEEAFERARKSLKET